MVHRRPAYNAVLFHVLLRYRNKCRESLDNQVQSAFVDMLESDVHKPEMIEEKNIKLIFFSKNEPVKIYRKKNKTTAGTA